MFFMGEYANIIAASGLVVTLYFGGWSLPGIAFTGIWGAIASIAVFFAKTLMFIALFIWVRWTFPRFRYDQLMDLGWKVLIPLALGWMLLLVGIRVGSDADWNPLLVVAVASGSLVACYGLLQLAFRASRRNRELEGVID